MMDGWFAVLTAVLLIGAFAVGWGWLNADEPDLEWSDARRALSALGRLWR